MAKHRLVFRLTPTKFWPDLRELVVDSTLRSVDAAGIIRVNPKELQLLKDIAKKSNGRIVVEEK